jgi:sugar porter (SP) family MFS transporter
MQLFDTFENYFNHIGTDKSQANMLGLLNNAFTIGSILSMFIVPPIVDRYGRKPSIVIGCILMVIGGVICTVAQNLGMLIGARVILGFGNSMSQLASPMLLTEIIHPQHRAPITAVYNCLWNLGSLICTFVGWGTSYVNNDWAWRSLCLLQIFPSVCQLLFIWFIPESPRWLISRDRNEEGLATLAKWHANGDINNATVQFEYREIRETLKIEVESSKTSYLDFMRTKGNRWRLAIIVSVGLISQYSGNAVISNYMNLIYNGAGITDQNQKLGISSGKTVLDLSVSIGAAFLVDKVGRRPLFLVAIFGMAFSFALWTIMAAMYEERGQQEGFGIAQILFVWIFGIFYDIGFSGLLVAYTLEVLPYHLRAKGIFIMNITVQATLALGGQTNPLAIANLPHQWNFWLFYTVSLPNSTTAHLSHADPVYHSSGTSSRPSGSTSSSLRPRDPPWRRLPRSLMARAPSVTSTSSRSRRRSRWADTTSMAASSGSMSAPTRRTWLEAGDFLVFRAIWQCFPSYDTVA